MITVPKGTKDVLPDSSHKWHFLERIIKETCALYGAREIRTPVFEHTELFLRSIGDDTDVVNKEMYTFMDKGGRSITLKPEGTAPVARSYVENSLEALSLPLKMYYITPVFRYERPQAGRLREHHQFGVEFYGSSSAAMDYEVISLAYKLLTKAGVKVTLKINSIGCEKCRKDYNLALKEFLTSHKEEMCPDCRTRLEKNPLRILDCKVPSCKDIIKGAPKITDFICGDCSKHMSELEEYLKDGGIPYVVDSGIVRGLDYYTRTVFEFVTDVLGAQGTVCGGGRYDNLVESIGGKPTPCVGFGMGLERLLMLMEASGVDISPDCVEYFVMVQRPEYRKEALKMVAALRSRGYSADTDFLDRSLKAQFKYADKIKARYAVVLGEEELASGTVKVKNLKDGTVTEKPFKDFYA